MVLINDQVLFATGDVMAQQGVEKVGLDKHNFARTGRMAGYGGGTSIHNPNSRKRMRQDVPY